MLSQFWNDPVWSKVIAGALLAGFSALFFVVRSRLPLPSRLHAAQPPRGRTLLFLSSGGTCRDPMAKAIATKLLATRKLKQRVTVEAAGMGPVSASKASYAARYVISEMYGEDLLKDHTPQAATPEMIIRADLILAMDKSVMMTAGKVLPPEKSFVLKEFFGIGGDVLDPWPDGKDPATLSRYRTRAEELRKILTDHLDQLVRVLDV